VSRRKKKEGKNENKQKKNGKGGGDPGTPRSRVPTGKVGKALRQRGSRGPFTVGEKKKKRKIGPLKQGAGRGMLVHHEGKKIDHGQGREGKEGASQEPARNIKKREKLQQGGEGEKKKKESYDSTIHLKGKGDLF